MNRLGAVLRRLLGAMGREVSSSAEGEVAVVLVLVLALGLEALSLEMTLKPRFLYSAEGTVLIVAGLDKAAAFSAAE